MLDSTVRIIPRLLPLLLITAVSAAVAQAPRPSCDLSVMHGRYAYTIQGTIFLQPPGATTLTSVAASMMGIAKIDWRGNVTGSITAIIGPQVMEGTLVDSTVQVNRDCTATYTATIQPTSPGGLPAQAVANWVILNDGDSIVEETVQSTLGTVVGIGHWRRISR